jgi:hypothetical protein
MAIVSETFEMWSMDSGVGDIDPAHPWPRSYASSNYGRSRD